MSGSLTALLRRQLAEVVDAERAAAPPLSTGIAALDRLLPGGGGLPRGRITEVVSHGGGTTTFVRGVVEDAVARRGLWVAYVDATRTLAPRDWAHLGAHEGFWAVRPRDPARGAWCADVLLRSGAFALVVLDGAPALPRAVAVRLARLAREGGAALLLVDHGGGHGGGSAGAPAVPLPGALRLRVRQWRRRRRLAVAIERGGAPGGVEVPCAIVTPRRLGTTPEPRDRRAGGRANTRHR
ncbi:MAG TPA: hypothetical protein VKA84_10905 [Gemmatimonadaceae bacterium]|nr:hypothetical protein [Gemmatimonadaceae bacterium]